MAVAVAQRRQARRLAHELKDAVARHRLLTFASAVSFRALVALIPLTLLGLGVLGALGQASVWKNSIAPTIRHHVTTPVFHGIDFSVQRIFASDKGSLITLATALVLWHMTAAVATVMETLNEIHDVKDERPWWRKLLVALGLAVAIVVCLVAAVLVVTVAPKIGSGAGHFVLGIGRWLVPPAAPRGPNPRSARPAPARHPRPRRPEPLPAGESGSRAGVGGASAAGRGSGSGPEGGVPRGGSDLPRGGEDYVAPPPGPGGVRHGAPPENPPQNAVEQQSKAQNE